MRKEIKAGNIARRSEQEYREMFINIMENLSLIQKRIVFMVIDGYTADEVCQMEHITLDEYKREMDMIRAVIRDIVD